MSTGALFLVGVFMLTMLVDLPIVYGMVLAGLAYLFLFDAAFANLVFTGFSSSVGSSFNSASGTAFANLAFIGSFISGTGLQILVDFLITSDGKINSTISVILCFYNYINLLFINV
jgi:hypothetical protein